MADDTNLQQADDLYVLGKLVERTGIATEAEVRLIVGKRDPNALTTEGTQVKTEKITTDCARNYGIMLDFWAKATSKQKELLPSLSDKRIQIIIWAAFHGQELRNRQGKGISASTTAQDRRRDTADSLREPCRSLRDRMHSLLDSVITGDPLFETDRLHAYGSMATDLALSAALSAQADLGAKLLASEDPEIVMRRQLTQLSPQLIAEVRSLAGRLESAAEAAQSARATPPVSQGQVDEWDGINLLLFGQVVAAFDAAHKADRTIPRLQPIALRRFFNRGRTKKPADETATPRSSKKRKTQQSDSE